MQDFLADEPMVEVVDFLNVEITASEEDHRCQGCSHPLTAHTRGMALHGPCGICRECPLAQLTESAKRKVKNGLLP